MARSGQWQSWVLLPALPAECGMFSLQEMRRHLDISGSIFWGWILRLGGFIGSNYCPERTGLLLMNTQAHTHTDISTHTYTHTWAYTYTHIQRHKHTHIRQKHTYTSTHTHTHISAQTRPLKKSLSYLFLIEFALRCWAGFRCIATWFSFICIYSFRFFSRKPHFLILSSLVPGNVRCSYSTDL